MPSEFSWNAKDQKAGMTAEELEAILDIIRRTRPGQKFHLKAKVGFSDQIRKLIFTEVESV